MTTDPDKRRKKAYAIGRAAGKHFRQGGAGREAAKRVGGNLQRRGIWRLIRRF